MFMRQHLVALASHGIGLPLLPLLNYSDRVLGSLHASPFLRTLPRVVLALVFPTLSLAATPRTDGEKLGLQALAAHLPDVAATRFRRQLEEHPGSSEDQVRLRILLGEALVRSQQPEQAKLVLQHESLSSSIVAIFWKAQAHRACGEVQAAIALFDQVIAAPNSPHFAEAILTRARLLTRMGSYREAIVGLNLLTDTKSPLATRARLDQTRLLLHTGKVEDARKVLPSSKQLSGPDRLDGWLLEAALLHAESSFAKAAQAFKAILRNFQKEGQPLPDAYHPAAIGYAKALAALQQRTEATDAILSFIQNHPQSPLLNEAFVLLRPLLLNASSSEDPVVTLIMARLSEWSKSAPAIHYAILPDTRAGAADRMPQIPTFAAPELHVQALYLRLLSLAQSNEAEAAENLRRLATQMRWEHPNHPLTQSATVELARHLYRQQRPEQARDLLQNLLLMPAAGSPEIEAQLLLAKNLFDQQDFPAAAIAFDRAAQSLQGTARNNALFNAATTHLLAHDEEEFKSITVAASPALRANLFLEQALFTAKQQPDQALPLLDRFIVDHPNHPRLLEARLAMAFCALEQIPPATSMAKALLDTIENEKNYADQIILAKIQLSAATQNHPQTIALCQQFLSTYPDSPQNAKVTLTLGSALYQNGDLNDARQTLQRLEKTHPDQAAPALLIAARAAARTGTPQSLAEAIELFDKIIQSHTPLATFAALEKARTLIDTKSPAALLQATNELEALVPKLSQNSRLQITAGLLRMEALYALGGSDPARHEQGLTLQENLLKNEELSDDDRNRICYFRGLTLEQLNQADQALETYYQVIESATPKNPAHWDFFERCGFNAIALLEKQQRWESAIALANRLARFPSPRAKEAAERANRLSLEHMILDESFPSE
jgi:tetratricopeptide (TPR) repeat protein